jgi:glutaminase
VDEYDVRNIHKSIGKEPSGQSFNSLFLNSESKCVCVCVGGGDSQR